MSFRIVSLKDFDPPHTAYGCKRSCLVYNLGVKWLKFSGFCCLQICSMSRWWSETRCPWCTTRPPSPLPPCRTTTRRAVSFAPGMSNITLNRCDGCYLLLYPTYRITYYYCKPVKNHRMVIETLSRWNVFHFYWVRVSVCGEWIR